MLLPARGRDSAKGYATLYAAVRCEYAHFLGMRCSVCVGIDAIVGSGGGYLGYLH